MRTSVRIVISIYVWAEQNSMIVQNATRPSHPCWSIVPIVGPSKIWEHITHVGSANSSPYPLKCKRKSKKKRMRMKSFEDTKDSTLMQGLLDSLKNNGKGNGMRIFQRPRNTSILKKKNVLLPKLRQKSMSRPKISWYPLASVRPWMKCPSMI